LEPQHDATGPKGLVAQRCQSIDAIGDVVDDRDEQDKVELCCATNGLWRAALPVFTPLEQHIDLDRLPVLVAGGSVAADKLIAALTQPRDQVIGQHLPFV
jgi:hypothetical protein